MTSEHVPTPPLPRDVAVAYLSRIRHDVVQLPSLRTLTSLQDAHVRAVPFENLDIHLGRPLSLELEDLATKVIDERRGGFCYELNGLFSALLTSLGFDTRLVEARELSDERLGPRFDHVRILVRLDGQTLLVDVGNGASVRGAIPLDGTPTQIGSTTHRIVESGGRLLSEESTDGRDWNAGWSFDTVARGLHDFAERCRFHQQDPTSHFGKKPLATLVTADGHRTLSDRRLITTTDAGREEHDVADPLSVLADRFGIVIPRWPGS